MDVPIDGPGTATAPGGRERFDRPHYLAVGMGSVPAHDGWLTEPEAERLARMPYTKRREESRLGRWAAKRALALALGCEDDPDALRRLVVRNASDGAPEVFIDGEPGGVGITMTDRADWAVCMVVHGATAIGCDLELVEPRSALFVADWFTASERDLVAGSPDRDLAANLIWSAKESALKVLRTGLRRDTRSVEVAVDLGSELGFSAARTDVHEGWRQLSVVAQEGTRFDGWWQRFGDFVLTYASAEPTAPPLSLVDPPGLHGAVPAHSWMASPRRPSPGGDVGT